MMRIGMVGLGRMGANMVRRLLAAGHECVVHDQSADAVKALAAEGAIAAYTFDELSRALPMPRAVWIMVPVSAVDRLIVELACRLEAGDVIIDGGNSYFRDDIRRGAELAAKKLHYVDVGVSGGVWGRERGYCLMIGGESDIVQWLDPVFAALAPGVAAAPRTPGRAKSEGTAERGYLHCGGHGAGHFVKMIHNGIEYGLMAAYAEGLNVLHKANIGNREPEESAEHAPLRDPRAYQYEFDVAEITEVWRRGSVISSWLLDLTAAALLDDSALEHYAGRVSDSGEGRWTLQAAIDEAVPVPVLSAAVYQRFSSRGEADFANRVLSAMRRQFGGHDEQPARGK